MARDYKKGNEYSQFDNGGLDLTETIQKLVNPKRGKGRLPPAPAREGIAEAKSESVPNSKAPSSGGIASPLTEQLYDGLTFYNLTSSDGFIVFEYPDQTEYIDFDGQTIVFVNYDYGP